FKRALSSIIEIASMGNRYINDMRPWEEPVNEAAKTLYTACSMVKTLAITLAPIIPGSAQRAWEMLGYEGDIQKVSWDEAKKPVKPGLRIREPKPLFRKINSEELRRKLLTIRQSSTSPTR
ncbi:MAG TPA: methionine--tRNA ligase, partial [Thermofilaceae archaeon]|nr:methionine--tRNA ligase [Thermofilaceae archaeon]